ncbi:hypothetical protein GGX14DRAFT_663311 [Mycena pura]|uniref:Uncharacterized protein n=1 Tax=Mycena pura TaxID=153505 RepID=A0AAD6YKV4_9AGAR|nr:hypothetical protein GGX14DRAFT_663311 [Mycena pura]
MNKYDAGRLFTLLRTNLPFPIAKWTPNQPGLLNAAVLWAFFTAIFLLMPLETCVWCYEKFERGRSMTLHVNDCAQREQELDVGAAHAHAVDGMPSPEPVPMDISPPSPPPAPIIFGPEIAPRGDGRQRRQIRLPLCYRIEEDEPPALPPTAAAAVAPSPEPAPVLEAPGTSPDKPREPPLFIRTPPNRHGIYKVYTNKPTHDPDDSTSIDKLCASPGLSVSCQREPALPDRSPSTPAWWPFASPTVARLMAWFHLGSNILTNSRLNSLVKDVMLTDDFNREDLRDFSAEKANKVLDNCTRPEGNSDLPPIPDKWKRESVFIKVPAKGVCEPEDSENVVEFEVEGLVFRELLDVMVENFSSPAFKDYHITPFECRLDPTHDPNSTTAPADLPDEPLDDNGLPPMPEGHTPVYGEVYTSKRMINMHTKLLNRDTADGTTPHLETIIAAYMFWSDSTHLATFGNASLWPLYTLFGNQSKYARACPMSNACHHTAYFPSLPDKIKDFYQEKRSEIKAEFKITVASDAFLPPTSMPSSSSSRSRSQPSSSRSRSRSPSRSPDGGLVTQVQAILDTLPDAERPSKRARRGPMSDKSPAEQIVSMARFWPRGIDTHLDIGEAVGWGATTHWGSRPTPRRTPPAEVIEKQKRLDKSFDLMLAQAPDIDDSLRDVYKAKKRWNDLLKLLREGAREARHHDTNGVRTHPEYALAPHESYIPHVKKNGSAEERGARHPHIRALLASCPKRVLLEETQVVEGKTVPSAAAEKLVEALLNGTDRYSHAEWPSIFYPTGAYKTWDPKDEDKDLFRSMYLVKIIRHVFTGPGSADDGAESLRPDCNAMAHGQFTVTGRIVGYACGLGRTSLSGHNWCKRKDGYDYTALFDNVVTMFEADPDDEWTTETLQWFNERVFSQDLADVKNSQDGDEEEEEIAAARCLRLRRERLEASAAAAAAAAAAQQTVDAALAVVIRELLGRLIINRLVRDTCPPRRRRLQTPPPVLTSLHVSLHDHRLYHSHHVASIVFYSHCSRTSVSSLHLHSTRSPASFLLFSAFCIANQQVSSHSFLVSLSHIKRIASTGFYPQRICLVTLLYCLAVFHSTCARRIADV